MLLSLKTFVERHWLLGLVVSLGLALRFYNNLTIPLWHDEAFSALMVKFGWSEMMARIGLDVHPPGYYIFLKLWNYAFGNSQPSVRGFSITFSALTVWASWLLTKEAFNDEVTARWVAVMTATNLFQLRLTTEARMYSFGIFFSLLAAYCLIKAIALQMAHHGQNYSRSHSKTEETVTQAKVAFYYTLFALSVLITIYTHYYLLFTAAAIGAYGLVCLYQSFKFDLKKYSYYLLAWVAVATAYSVWFQDFLIQYRQVSADFWPPKLGVWSYPGIFWDFLIGTWYDPGNIFTSLGLVSLTAFTGYFFLVFLRRTDNVNKWLIAFATAAPFAGSMLFNALNFLKGSNTSIFYNRYFLFANVFYLIALAVWASRYRFGKYLLGTYILLNLAAFTHYWLNMNMAQRQGVAAAASLFNKRVVPGEKIYVLNPHVYFSFKHYNHSNVAALLYYNGTTDVRNVSFNNGSAILTNEELLPSFDDSAVPGNAVWLLWQGVETTFDIPRNWYLVEQHRFVQVDPELKSPTDVQHITMGRYRVL